jgi:DNA-binding HxlR family transcriptional regulator
MPSYYLVIPTVIYNADMPRRSYDQFCPLARSLDVIGERWTLLIVRELMAGPRRYTDLHADLPGASTDILAARLKDMEHDGLLTRRRLPPPGAAAVYELTPRARGLLPAITALAEWGAAGLEEQRPTDARRAHWSAIPLMHLLAGLDVPQKGTIDVRLDEGTFHIVLDDTAPSYAHGPADQADADLTMDSATCLALVQGTTTLPEAVRTSQATITGDSPLADSLRLIS